MDDRIKLEATDGHAKHRGYKGVPLKPQVRACLGPQYESEFLLAQRA